MISKRVAEATQGRAEAFGGRGRRVRYDEEITFSGVIHFALFDEIAEVGMDRLANVVSARCSGPLSVHDVANSLHVCHLASLFQSGNGERSMRKMKERRMTF